jgi:hypothetical protein
LLTYYPAISAIEEKAKFYRDIARMTRFYRGRGDPFWTEEENIEMAARVMVRKDFSDLLDGSLPLPDLEALKKVLFGVVYLTCG